MSPPVTYDLRDSIATIAMDDGKRNALSIGMLTGINRALDRAAADRAVVIFTGREGAFSGGFDLRVLAGGWARRARDGPHGLRAGGAHPVVPGAGGRRVHGPRDRDGRVPAPVG